MRGRLGGDAGTSDSGPDPVRRGGDALPGTPWAAMAANSASATSSKAPRPSSAVVVMAVLWGSFAAPHAARRLTGAAGVAFRAGWFGGGLLALLGLLL